MPQSVTPPNAAHDWRRPQKPQLHRLHSPLVNAFACLTLLCILFRRSTTALYTPCPPKGTCTRTIILPSTFPPTRRGRSRATKTLSRLSRTTSSTRTPSPMCPRLSRRTTAAGRPILRISARTRASRPTGQRFRSTATRHSRRGAPTRQTRIR